MGNAKAPFHIIVICNDCDKRFDMFPRGDQDDAIICSCGRAVESHCKTIQFNKKKKNGN